MQCSAEQLYAEQFNAEQRLSTDWGSESSRHKIELAEIDSLDE
jgi:hypothetical protein